MTYLFIDTGKIKSELEKISICAEDFDFQDEYTLSFCVSSGTYDGNIPLRIWDHIVEKIKELYNEEDISDVYCDTCNYKITVKFTVEIESV